MITTLFLLGVGIITATNVHDRYLINNQIAKLEAENYQLIEEHKKLKLEESMLVTDALLDRDTREHLGMVIPDHNAVVYVIESADSVQVVERNGYDNQHLQ